MTGPWHYREAENLLAMAAEQMMAATAGDPTAGGPREPGPHLAAAQAHATLALAAAVAVASSAAGMRDSEAAAWSEAAGGDPRGADGDA